MSNVTRPDRFTPFNRLDRWNPFEEMDELFNRFMMRPMLRGTMANEPQIRMDVREVDGAYLVEAEIPGASKEDVHVTIEGKRVSISAEIKAEKEEGERVICSERPYGNASRSFNLASEVDQDKVQARYSNGILELMLPKKHGAAHREIPVS
ncbi:MAG TPA: Hsp20/alpha crystallin family protein [Gallionella sp.]|nr:Hsp20/alpha crystallin family protein [Gallionella sp.]